MRNILSAAAAVALLVGIAAGAQLAMTTAVGFFPLLIGLPREIAAFAGGLIAVVLVLALSWRRGLDPVLVYARLAEDYRAPKLRGPLNMEARLAAGFAPEELEAIAPGGTPGRD